MSDECPMCGWTAGTNAASCGECFEREQPDLARVWALLDQLVEAGAVAAAATFFTRHAVVVVTSSRDDGRGMTVNGERVPMEGAR